MKPLRTFCSDLPQENQTLQGLVVPLFSLTTPQSSGIGEFLDLIPLIDWMSEQGFHLLQLLPINETGDDASPYSLQSSLALHPIYLSLWGLPDFSSCLDIVPDSIVPHSIDWVGVRNHKRALLKKWLDERSKNELKSLDYPWKKELKDPLNAHSLVLGPRYGFTAEEYMTLQAACYSQMARVKEHAALRGVYLLGDLPILYDRHSADCILHPEWFDFNRTVGAPPDHYSLEGQSWGFPLCSWKKIEESDFQTWRERINIQRDLYDGFRIDHAVGFFRLWSIPQGESATKGSYTPREEVTALEEGAYHLKKLVEIGGDLLPIAEDLGVVLPEMRHWLKELHIPGIKVVIWERNWQGDQSYIPLKNYPPCSVTMLTTHDSETILSWWENCPQDAKKLCETFDIPYQKQLDSKTLLTLIRRVGESSSFGHLFGLGEVLYAHGILPHLERINTPGTICPKNWSVRYPAFQK